MGPDLRNRQEITWTFGCPIAPHLWPLLPPPADQILTVAHYTSGLAQSASPNPRHTWTPKCPIYFLPIPKGAARFRLCRKTPSSARERDIFSSGKNGEAGDVCSIVDAAGCSQAKRGPLEARSSFLTQPVPRTTDDTVRSCRRTLRVEWVPARIADIEFRLGPIPDLRA